MEAYKRIEIDPGPFADFCRKGEKKFYQRSFELPKRKGKKNGIDVEITDLRPLNEVAVYVIESLLSFMAHTGEREFTYNLAESFDRSKLDLIVDIVTAFDVKLEYKGGAYACVAVCTGSCYSDEDETVTFMVEPELSEFLHEYAGKQEEGAAIDFLDAVIKYEEWLKEKYKDVKPANV